MPACLAREPTDSPAAACFLDGGLTRWLLQLLQQHSAMGACASPKQQHCRGADQSACTSAAPVSNAPLSIAPVSSAPLSRAHLSSAAVSRAPLSSAAGGCREEGGQGSQGSVVVANDAERPLAAHRRTSSRPMEDLSLHRSSSGAAQAQDEVPPGGFDSKKDK